ncbi:hypothetical protein V7122_07035 [Bacillus sp. JJ1532]
MSTSRSQANPPRKEKTPFREARLVLVGLAQDVLTSAFATGRGGL